jgi:L-rhamnose isomerase
MAVNERYEYSKKIYQKIGVDTDSVIRELDNIKISMHCWQGDDVQGFEHKVQLSGGIQATGNYPGKARNYVELMDDIDKAFSLIPGKHKINLHACYAIFEDNQFIDRNELKPVHFKKWVEFAKKRGLGIDFNPTFFAHPKAEFFTLSSPDEEIRNFWIEHGKACIRISEYFAEQLGQQCLMNIWIPDGYKDIPSDRYSPRERFKDSLDKILSIDYNKDRVLISLESKLFGIGLESYTVGSSEFCLSYAAKNNIISLMDNGHYHPTEKVSDKISSMLLFNKKIALHITRGVRWDSDHVVLFDEETCQIAKEIVCNKFIDRVMIGLDYFDASINRVAAWVLGMRNVQKALLYALLIPFNKLAQLQKNNSFTELLVMQEELKLYPFNDIWDYYCEINDIPKGDEWFNVIKVYENEVLNKRV